MLSRNFHSRLIAIVPVARDKLMWWLIYWLRKIIVRPTAIPLYYKAYVELLTKVRYHLVDGFFNLAILIFFFVLLGISASGIHYFLHY